MKVLKPRGKYQVPNYYDESQQLIENHKLHRQLLQLLQLQNVKSDDVAYVYNIFCALLDLVSSNSDSRSLFLASDLWEAVLFKESNNVQFTKLQDLFLSKREIFVHILMNQRYYEPYNVLIAPLFAMYKQLQYAWCDVMADTFQFSETPASRILFNDSNIVQFLRSSNNTLVQKRTLLANFLRKGLMYTRREEEIILTHFFKYLELFEDRDCLLDKQEHSPYYSALFLIIDDVYGKNVPLPMIESIFEDNYLNKDYFYNFLTTLINVCSVRSPSVSLKVWEFKQARDQEHGNILQDKDLTYVMKTLISLRKFPKIFELSSQYPNLYHEHQLALLLTASKDLKDWTMLQKQFEALYGRGNLPFAIHYSIVMSALVKLGAKKDIDRLFAQLKKRNIRPTSSIYASIIAVRVRLNELEEAKKVFNDFLADSTVTDATEGGQDFGTPQLYGLLFDVYLKSTNKNDLLELLDQSLQTQEALNLTIIDAGTMEKIINYFEECYGFKEVLHLKSICEKLNLMEEEVYCSLIQAYVRFGQYEMAESLVYEAHYKSLLPLKNSKILKDQLRNYRIWHQDCHNRLQKDYIDSKRDLVLDRVRNNEITPKGTQTLYSEVIKFYLGRNQMGVAYDYFDRVVKNKWGQVSENIYAPLLKYLSKSLRLKDHEAVLAMYEGMVKLNVKITMNTYDSIMRSVVFLDKHNDNGYSSCDRLLQSIFEMNGLYFPPISSQQEQKTESQLTADIDNNAIFLCRMVSTYIINKPGTQNEKVDFVVDFLTQLRRKLNNQMGLRLRITIYKEIGKLYSHLQNLHMAKSLISGGVHEINSFVTNYIQDYPLPYEYKFEIRLPQSLKSAFKGLLHLNLQILELSKAEPGEYLKLLNMSEDNNLKLDGSDYNNIISQLMKLDNDQGLEPILSIIQEHLATGNFNELGLMRLFQFLYKLFILDKSKRMSDASIQLRYRIFNDFYGVTDISKLKSIFPPNMDIISRMNDTLNSIRERFPSMGNWDLQYVLDKPEIFFSPEKQLSTANKLNNYLNDKLFFRLEEYWKGDNHRLFPLMDKYPDAIELILINQITKKRLKAFRSQISKVIEPPVDTIEGFASRRTRTLRALHKMFRPLHGQDN